MKSSSLALYCSAILAVTDAHWIFDRIVYEGKWTEPFEYVREVSPANTTDSIALVYPNTDPDSTDIRCGRNATLGWSNPKTAPMKAGDSLGFIVNEASVGKGKMYHPGFASAWLSKAPSDDLNSYLGDGDWFKIMSVTGRTEQSFNTSDPANQGYDKGKVMWGAYNSRSWNFTIPATTPPGKYLARFEYIFPNEYDAQFYIGCAHIDIQNSGTAGTPGPLVKLPGNYKRGQPDVYFYSYDYYIGGKHIEDFVPPYPPVWQG